MAWIARFGDTLYNPPYDWHVVVPAYLTFLEPVIASLASGALIWRQLPNTMGERVVASAAVIFAIKGPMVAPIINIPYAGVAPATAILSMGQFFFEAIALATLTAVALAISNRRNPTTRMAATNERLETSAQD